MKLKGRTDLLCDLPNGMRSRRFDGLPNTFGDGDDRLNVKHDYARGRLTKRDYLNDRCSINARIFTEQFFGR